MKITMKILAMMAALLTAMSILVKVYHPICSKVYH